MFKIKLLILLLISLIINSCSPNILNNNSGQSKFKIDYISGERDGLNLLNKLEGHLKLIDLHDDRSTLLINAEVNNSQDLYITNIDNTSDRENIKTTLKITITDLEKNCEVYRYNNFINQYYVIASSEQYSSNKAAITKIKDDNIEYLINDFISELIYSTLKCNEQSQ